LKKYDSLPDDCNRSFNDRGKGDFYLSHDLEDIVTLVDGRAGIVEDVKDLAASAPAARNFIADECAKLLPNPYFSEAI
jgi:hypothetical protein